MPHPRGAFCAAFQPLQEPLPRCHLSPPVSPCPAAPAPCRAAPAPGGAATGPPDRTHMMVTG
eukprot:4623092-Prymnesium_polylepis.1